MAESEENEGDGGDEQAGHTFQFEIFNYCVNRHDWFLIQITHNNLMHDLHELVEGCLISIRVIMQRI